MQFFVYVFSFLKIADSIRLQFLFFRFYFVRLQFLFFFFRFLTLQF